MRRYLFILIFCAVCTPVLSQTAPDLLPVRQNGKWGFIDTTGNLIINMNHGIEDVKFFHRVGIIIFRKGAGFGLMNLTGTEVIPPLFDEIRILGNELVALQRDTLWGCQSFSGDNVLPIEYERIELFKQNGFLSIFNNQLWGIADRNGNVLKAPTYDTIDVHQSSYFLTDTAGFKGLIDFDGNEICPPIYGKIKVESNDIIFCTVKDKWGAINHKGEQIIPHEWANYQFLSSYFVELYDRDNNLYMHFPASGKSIKGGSYSRFRILPSDEDKNELQFLLAYKDGNAGIIDSAGTVLIEPTFKQIIQDGNLFIVKNDRYWGLLNIKGEELTRPQFDYIYDFNGPIAKIKRGELYGIINKNGEEVIPGIYRQIQLGVNMAKVYEINGSVQLYEFDEQGEVAKFEIFKKVRTISVGKRKHFQFALDTSTVFNTRSIYRWVLDSEKQKWGLWNTEADSLQIKAIYDRVEQIPSTDLTIVEWRRRNSRPLLGLVNHKDGKPLTSPSFAYINGEDFTHSPIARSRLMDGNFVLLHERGFFVMKGFNYSSAFKNGLARINYLGTLYCTDSENNETLSTYNDFFQNWIGTSSNTTLFRNCTGTNPGATTENVRIKCKNCRWGFIDTLGRQVIKADYDWVEEFNNGTAIVRKGDKYGVINTSGKLVIDLIYDHIQYMPNADQQLFQVAIANRRQGIINRNGKVVIDLNYDKVTAFKEGKVAVKKGKSWGFADTTGKVVIDVKYYKVQPFHEGLAAVMYRGKWGYVNHSGEMVIKPVFTRASSFHEGKAWVSQKGKFGYINLQGEFVIEPQFHNAYDFQNGRARVRINSRTGTIDTAGNWVIKPDFHHIEAFNQYGLAIVRKKKNKHGVINQKGEQIVAARYRKIHPFREGLARVYKGRKYGFVDTLGNELVKPAYSRAGDFSDGLAKVQLGSGWGYINSSGAMVIHKNFKRAFDFDEGVAIVQSMSGSNRPAYGLIDKKGDFIILPAYEKFYGYNEGIGAVRNNGRHYFINAENERIFSRNFPHISAFTNGYSAVVLNKKWGVIDRRGFDVISGQFDKIAAFENGYATVNIKTLTGVADLNGNMVIEPQFGAFTYLGSGIFRVEKGAEIGYLRSNGYWLWELQE